MIDRNSALYLSALTSHYYNWHNQLPGNSIIQAHQTKPDPNEEAFLTVPQGEDAYPGWTHGRQ